ncbi:MAG: hypothetical protein H6970_03055 [Gammaproteobacteria bacterium]|nr:hypothetical protein [Gammaproteobacteria bacterium]MCP5424036.1 hypothetical protein [Gammaproteobacteria bacterium]MCP5459530.1 hypothetical protein [Gammaproteobacteria bacterium]
MSRAKMLILRGNSARAGTYPDEKGDKIAWPLGALHVQAAKDYANRRGYDAIVLDAPGQPQSGHSPQTKAALKKFLEDPTTCAFYGFSGGGYNLWHILHQLASLHTESLHRIDLVVVLGSPKTHKTAYQASGFNSIARKKVHPAQWKDAQWEVVYGTNPPPNWPLPPGVPSNAMRHMFCPEWLLAGMPAK